MKYEREEIKKKVNIAIDILFKNDSFLLENNVNERSISHKLAEYLQIMFPEWHVDCEYNRREWDIKKINGIEECSEERTTDRIFPDIIVHHRSVNDNLLVIEIKPNKKDDPCDIRKLKLLTQKEGEYGYDWGVYIQFMKNEKPFLTWFNGGKVYERTN